MSSDLSARLDRLADHADEIEQEAALRSMAGDPLRPIVELTPATCRALVKVAQATKYVRPLDMPVALSEALAALDVQLAKGEQDVRGTTRCDGQRR